VADETWTILKVLNWTQGRFAERRLATPRLDAEVLLSHILKKDRVALYMYFDQPLQAGELAAYRELIKRRLAGEPVAYLVGKKEFHSLELIVDARVLVPRPDSEATVELALECLGDKPTPRIVDIGTGSGAIALALKKERPDSTVIAVDKSPEAAEVARQNATRLGLAVEVVVGEFIAPEGAFDLIVSNPPYIPTGEIATLSAEVRREPRLALDGGADGLEVIRKLIELSRGRLQSGGALVIEVGAGQAPAVADRLMTAGLRVKTKKDLGGIERAVAGLQP
jgi:release factor glutamine methyltransferase